MKEAGSTTCDHRVADVIYLAMEKLRDYKCSVQGCQSFARAKGLCNAHYIRHRKGRSLDGAVKLRNFIGCLHPGCLEKHYGKSLCRRHWAIQKRHEVKMELVRLLGGTCAHCGQEFPAEVFDFHHKNRADKEYGVSRQLTDNPAMAKAEALKCLLLCANCHRIETHREESEIE